MKRAEKAKPIQETIMAHWNSGKSSGVIAQIMGVSRNVVIGHVARLRIMGYNLQAREDPNKVIKKGAEKKARASVYDEKIIALWGQGLHPKDIAERLGVTLSCVRSRAVILRKGGHELRRSRGKRGAADVRSDRAVQSRLHKKRERAAKTGNADAAAAARFAAKIDAMPCFNTVITDTKPIEISGLASVGSSRGTCHWPLMVEGKTLFCGAAIEGKSPYCAGHHALAFPKASQARRAA